LTSWPGWAGSLQDNNSIVMANKALNKTAWEFFIRFRLLHWLGEE
jgi:hypothetical protein